MNPESARDQLEQEVRRHPQTPGSFHVVTGEGSEIPDAGFQNPPICLLSFLVIGAAAESLPRHRTRSLRPPTPDVPTRPFCSEKALPRR